MHNCNQSVLCNKIYSTPTCIQIEDQSKKLIMSVSLLFY